MLLAIKPPAGGLHPPTPRCGVVYTSLGEGPRAWGPTEATFFVHSNAVGHPTSRRGVHAHPHLVWRGTSLLGGGVNSLESN